MPQVREADNPDYAWLHESAAETTEGRYYRWRVYSLLQVTMARTAFSPAPAFVRYCSPAALSYYVARETP